MVSNIEFFGTLARDTFVSERVGQSDAGQTVSPAKTVSGQSVTGQIATLAKVPPSKCLWPTCHSGQIVIQPENSNPVIDKEDTYTF